MANPPPSPDLLRKIAKGFCPPCFLSFEMPNYVIRIAGLLVPFFDSSIAPRRLVGGRGRGIRFRFGVFRSGRCRCSARGPVPGGPARFFPGSGSARERPPPAVPPFRSEPLGVARRDRRWAHKGEGIDQETAIRAPTGTGGPEGSPIRGGQQEEREPTPQAAGTASGADHSSLVAQPDRCPSVPFLRACVCVFRASQGSSGGSATDGSDRPQCFPEPETCLDRNLLSKNPISICSVTQAGCLGGAKRGKPDPCRPTGGSEWTGAKSSAGPRKKQRGRKTERQPFVRHGTARNQRSAAQTQSPAVRCEQHPMPLLSLDSRARARVVTTAILISCLRILERHGTVATTRNRQVPVAQHSSPRWMLRMNSVDHHKLRY
ncbi:unnamed protein product [Pseudo-nitzschia multistriata]|uniref:Uncharacterized protein n=1 Tax=Pseudo-nitzschia multistriata TaxID=183589 RepID=A0A448ZGU2_9STRA|nr:unnamed protein product [Pseudo-nitzschia multistriata]